MAPASVTGGRLVADVSSARTLAVDQIAQAVRLKLDCLADRKQSSGSQSPRFLDLFAGCGGITLGFKRAGGIPLGGIEKDADAAKTYARNFHSATEAELALHSRPLDITKLDPETIIAEWGHVEPRQAVDIVVGGPPCPAYARIGRAKLREISNHPQAHRRDPRAKLYVPYLRFVKALAPVALVMENVPEILNFGGHNLAEEMCEVLEGYGYDCAYTLLNAANYGVPQTRERFFLMAIHKEAGVAPSFPRGTHQVVLPQGYRGTRSHALAQVRGATAKTRFLEPPPVSEHAKPAVTAWEALADLPPLDARSQPRTGEAVTGAVRYRRGGRLNAFAVDMRTWPGAAAQKVVRNHVTRRLTDRDFRIFARMKPGDDYPAAIAVAKRLFDSALRHQFMVGEDLQPRSKAYRELRRAYIPPYDVTKFANKWRKMESDGPARTLMAHLGKDTYSHIHFDSKQSRTISVREAARLQSFPDGFVLPDTLNPAFRQIGNSVPPLLAFRLAQHLLELLDGA